MATLKLVNLHQMQQTSTNTHSASAIGNDTEWEREKEKEHKNWIVNVCLDLDIKIIGEAFVSSLTMGVEWQQYVNNEVVAHTKKVVSKKQTRKFGKVHESNKNLWSR